MTAEVIPVAPLDATDEILHPDTVDASDHSLEEQGMENIKLGDVCGSPE